MSVHAIPKHRIEGYVFGIILLSDIFWASKTHPRGLNPLKSRVIPIQSPSSRVGFPSLLYRCNDLFQMLTGSRKCDEIRIRIHHAKEFPKDWSDRARFGRLTKENLMGLAFARSEKYSFGVGHQAACPLVC